MARRVGTEICAPNNDVQLLLTAAAEDDTLRLVTEPFSADADFVRTLARRLSIQQRPVDTFRVEFLTGQIPKNQEELEAQKRRKKW